MSFTSQFPRFNLGLDTTMANSHSEGPPHDLSADDSRRSNGDAKTADSVHEPNQVEVDHSCPRSTSDALTLNDVSPIEEARERLLYIVAKCFIERRITEVPDSEDEFTVQDGQVKLRKRSKREVKFEGDPLCDHPLLYVANIYETLVTQADIRLASLDGFVDKTIGVDLEAVEGLYRILARKFPEKGPCIFGRREVTCPFEAQRWFPGFRFEKDKEVSFMVVNGLDIIEKPDTLSVVDGEWFKRLTGRSEVSISVKDYKFYLPRHNFQRVVSDPIPTIFGSPKKKLSSSQGNSPPKTPRTQPPLGSSLPQTSGESHGTSSSAKSMESKAHANPPNIITKSPTEPHEFPYALEIPTFMFPYITDFCEDVASRNCGFQAIAEQIRMGNESGWLGVRRDLFIALASEPEIYTDYAPVFTSDSVKEILKAIAFWIKPVSPPEHQFSTADMGHIVATHYGCVFVVLGKQPVTFLPLYLHWEWDRTAVIFEYCIVYLCRKKSFISVEMIEDFPLPPIHHLWADNHHTSVNGFDLRFAERFQKYEWLQSFM